MKRLTLSLLVVAVAATGLVAAPSADAHYTSDFYDMKWETEYESCFLVFFSCSDETRDIEWRFTGGGWTTQMLQRIVDGGNGIDQTRFSYGQHLNFSYEGHTGDLPDCSGSDHNENVVRWVDHGNLDYLATITPCGYAGDEMVNFVVTYNFQYWDTTQPCGDVGGCFYYGTGHPADHPDHPWDFWQTSLHELMHGLGFGVNSPKSHFAEGSSTCPEGYGRDGDDREAMCQYHAEGTAIRSLRYHERRLNQNWYDG